MNLGNLIIVDSGEIRNVDYSVNLSVKEQPPEKRRRSFDYK